MWSLPSRNRPASLKRFIDAYTKTSSSTKIFVRLDEDDESLEEYLKIEIPKTFVLKVGPRQGLTAAMNEMFYQFPDEEYYGLGADDIIPQTPNWDARLSKTCGLKKISYPNDLGKKSKRDLPSHPCCGGDLVREVGWFANPGSKHYFIDNTWKFIGENLGSIIRLEDTVVEHVHYSRKKSEYDKLYQENENSHFKSDQHVFNDWCEHAGKELIDRLRRKGFGI